MSQFMPSSATDGIATFNSIPLNLTTLRTFNYTVYPDNSTFSNASSCYLLLPPSSIPTLLDNGTVLYALTCFTPFHPIGIRGALSLFFAILFALSIVLSLANLKKHGGLPSEVDSRPEAMGVDDEGEKSRRRGRFRAVGKRWVYYWMIVVGACGVVSAAMSVDVERYYLVGSPLVLQGALFEGMVLVATAAAWEAVRGWGSFQRRQMTAIDSFSPSRESHHSRMVLYLPLAFYFLTGLSLILTVPRSWTPIEKQNSAWQIDNIARPAATGPRVRAGALVTLCAWLVIIASFHHSLISYGNQRPTIRVTPPKLLIAAGLVGITLIYRVASAWMWDICISRAEVPLGWPFGLGYGPVCLLVYAINLFAFFEESEEQVLGRQRRARTEALNAEMGIDKRPRWWSSRVQSQRPVQTTHADGIQRTQTEDAPSEYERGTRRQSALKEDDIHMSEKPGEAEKDTMRDVEHPQKSQSQPRWSMLDV